MVIITDAGMVMRMPLDQVNTLSRVTQGVRLMKLKDDSTIATVSIVDKEKKDDIENDEVINNNDLEISNTIESVNNNELINNEIEE